MREPELQTAPDGPTANRSALPHVRNPDLRRLVDHWLVLRDERRLPARRDVDPLEIPWILSRVWICDYLAEGRRFRYRLAGELINTRFGRNISNLHLDEIVPAKDTAWITAKFCKVVDGPAIVHDIGRVYMLDDTLGFGERVILPLSDDGRTVTNLLGATHYDIDAAWAHRGGAIDQQVTTVTML